MLVTLAGIEMPARPLEANAKAPMLVTFGPMMMPVRLKQLDKAPTPMLVTLVGITRLVRSLKEKA